MSLKSRSIRAGLVQGVFGQANRNTKRKKDMEDRMKEMNHSFKLERSKSRFEVELENDKKRQEFTANLTAIRGVGSDGNFNDDGFRYIAEFVNKNWTNMTKPQQDEFTSNMSRKNMSASEFTSNRFGNKTDPSKVGEILTGSPHQKAGEFGAVKSLEVFQTNAAPTSPTAPVDAGFSDEDRDPTRALGTNEKEVDSFRRDNEDGTQTLVRVMEDTQTGETRQIETNLGKQAFEDENVVPMTGVFIKTDGTKVEVQAFKSDTSKEGKQLFYFDGNGNRAYDLITENEVQTERRAAEAQGIAQAKERHVAAMGAYEATRELLDIRNVADIGGQGLINSAAEWLTTNINFHQSAEAGKEVTREVREALGVPDNLTPRKAKEWVKNKLKDERANDIFNAMVPTGGVNELSDEEIEEYQALARRAATNVIVGSLVVLAAKARRGAGKLNKDDLERMDNIINAQSGVASFEGGVRQLQKEMYFRGKQDSAALVSSRYQFAGGKLEGGQYLERKGKSSSSGFMFKVGNPTSGQPAWVFVSSNSGDVVGFADNAQAQQWLQTEDGQEKYNKIPEPTTNY